MDCRCLEHHEKCTCDGLTHMVKGVVEKGAVDTSGENVYGAGTRELVLHLARTHRSPDVKRHLRHIGASLRTGRSSQEASAYVYMFLSPLSVDHELVNASKEYAVSKGDYSFVSSDSNMRDCQLQTRNFVCTCLRCLVGKTGECVMESWAGPMYRRTITAATPIERRVTRGGKSLTAFCQTLQINDYAVHRIADSEKGDVADQEYFIVRIESNVRKITAPNETFGTNDFKRGSFVVQVRWLEVQSEDGNGNRLYSRPHNDVLHILCSKSDQTYHS